MYKQKIKDGMNLKNQLFDPPPLFPVYKIKIVHLSITLKF